MKNSLKYCLIFAIAFAVFSLKQITAQNDTATIAYGDKHKISFSQETDFAVIAFCNPFRYLFIKGRNFHGFNMDFAINYNYRLKRGDEILVNFVYTYDKDRYRYVNYYMDEYGLTEISLDAHFIRLEFGMKYYTKRSKVKRYTRVSASISFSLYRRNIINQPGLYHYQEFKGLHYSHINFLWGKGVEIPTYKNQFFMAEAGFDLPLAKYNYSNLIYSFDVYFKIGYGFTF